MSVSFNLNSPNPPFRRYAVSTPRNLITCSCGASSQNRARTPPLRRSATWRGFRAAEGLRNENKVGVLDGINHEEKKREENHRSESEDENDEGLNEKSLEPESSSNVGSSKVVYRRQKGAVVANVDLLVIPGVGPRNLRKLVGKGFAGVAQLKQLYRDKFFGKSSVRMVEFLRSSVGIVHKDHAESITSFIEESVDEELKEDSTSDLKPTQKKRLTFCVEGNISVGKTTFLQRIANETLELRDLVEIVPEPINKWQDIGPDHFNILDAFYAEPQRYAYTFQNYVFVTRVMQERDSADGIKPLRLMERSVFRDRMVFVRAVHEAKWMNEMEISIYNSWFDPVVSTLPGLILDGFIYLRASPDTCYRRMMMRKRAEEGGVSLDYLKGLHEKHESWLLPFETGNHGVLSFSELPVHMDKPFYPNIRDRVFYLEGNHLHPCIQKVPALVLDCEPNIDFIKDIDAKRDVLQIVPQSSRGMASSYRIFLQRIPLRLTVSNFAIGMLDKVAEFFEFVKTRRDGTPPKTGGTDEKKSMGQQIMPPREGLWVPNGTPFPCLPLESLDLRRALSCSS